MMRKMSLGGEAGSLDCYLDQIRATDLLSADEEAELARAVGRGDRDAWSRMIRGNLRLVVRVARDYLGRGLSLDDLVGEGNLGLIRAVGEFDPGFGTRFSTYASYWIKQAIRVALTNTASTIRLPAHMVALMTRWRRAERELSRQLGRTPTSDQVADVLGLTESQRLLVDRAQRASTIRGEGGGEDGDWTIDARDDGDVAPEATMVAREAHQDIYKRLERLDARERTIIELRFGLLGDEPLTLKEVGLRLGMTREWVRRIEQRAVRKLEPENIIPAPPARTRPRAASAGPNRRPRSAFRPDPARTGAISALQLA